jgi:hypothetical protein
VLEDARQVLPRTKVVAYAQAAPHARANTDRCASPVGWCAVEPRTAYVRLGRVPWADRPEDTTVMRVDF